MPVLSAAIERESLSNLVVVAPDAGGVKRTRLWAARLKAGTAIADKMRIDHSETAEVVELIGNVEGKTALIVDDFTISANTLISAAEVLIDRGDSAVYAAVSHCLLNAATVERLNDSPIEKLLITNSVENHPVDLPTKIEVISVASLFGEAIRRIAHKESISVLFA